MLTTDLQCHFKEQQNIHRAGLFLHIKVTSIPQISAKSQKQGIHGEIIYCLQWNDCISSVLSYPVLGDEQGSNKSTPLLGSPELNNHLLKGLARCGQDSSFSQDAVGTICVSKGTYDFSPINFLGYQNLIILQS